MKIYLIKKEVRFKDYKDNKKQVTLKSILWANKSLEETKKEISQMIKTDKLIKDEYERKYYIQEIDLWE